MGRDCGHPDQTEVRFFPDRPDLFDYARHIDPLRTDSAVQSPGATPCSHCGLPVPPALVKPDEPHQFCCDGCRTVWAVLHDEGLEQYYTYRERAGAVGRRARTTGGAYDYFDDPAFIEANCRALPEGLMAIDLYLEGVHCSACLWLVERTTVLVPGVAAATLDLGRSVVHVVFDPTGTKLSELGQRLDSLGYPPHPHRGAQLRERRRREGRDLIARIAVAGAAAGNIMLVAAALYGGHFEGMQPEFVRFFRWVSLLVATPAVLWSGSVFFRGAWGALQTRTAHMDLPITIGILTGYAWGAFNTVRGSGEIYFDSVTALVFLLLVGRWLQRTQQRSAADAAELLTSLAPATARLVEGDGDERTVREVPVEALTVGALVEIRAGENAPADGVVATGTSSVDVSWLTGEPVPVEVEAGDEVYAGCVNLSAPLVVRVMAAGETTRVGLLLRRVEEAAQRRAPVVQLADRVSGYFVVTVLFLALVTLVLWLFWQPTHAVDHVVALLIVACPCALGLATPLAIAVAIGQAARRGILVKGGDALEHLARPGIVFFDKTGTLTQGRLSLVEWEGDATIQPLVHAVERASAHPVAQALVAATPSDPRLRATDVQHRLGAGLSARVGGREVIVGSPGYVGERVGELPAWAEEAAARHGSKGRTPVLIAVDGGVRALAALADPLRPDAESSLRELGALGYKLAVLSGDHPSAVEAVAAELGVSFVECLGGISPEGKLERVEAAARRGSVVMVGDGANDAAALSAATVGVAVHGGAEASVAAADVFTTTAGVAPVAQLVAGARRTLSVIRRNVAFSLVYNLATVALAMAGAIGPLLAAVLMPLSSLTVVTSSYRARIFR